MKSLCWIVCSLCAMLTTVHFSFLISSRTFASDMLSRALVPSSKIMIFGLRSRPLASASLCFCPPLKFEPLKDTSLSSPFLSATNVQA
mmetsp:Transcript_18060/g.32359  ORF Transcript_18060/g.32359 Transcript_18060/m.32359 type:complete len:88 (-) Transcript_18060:3321-3584(-)